MRMLPLLSPMPKAVRHVRESFAPKAKATGRIYVECWQRMEREGGGLAYRVRRVIAGLSLFLWREGERDRDRKRNQRMV